jgi:hypothetical protein
MSEGLSDEEFQILSGRLKEVFSDYSELAGGKNSGMQTRERNRYRG